MPWASVCKNVFRTHQTMDMVAGTWNIPSGQRDTKSTIVDEGIWAVYLAQELGYKLPPCRNAGPQPMATGGF